MKRFVLVTAIALVLGFTPIAHAGLVDNGGGLIWDPALNITWYDSTSYRTTWLQAQDWISGLNNERLGGVTGWRLPQTLPVNGSTYNYTGRPDGSTDVGFNITSPNSEMAYLYYVELGNLGWLDAKGNSQTDVGGLKHLGPFTSLLSDTYWSGSDYYPGSSGMVWIFIFYEGLQTSDDPYWNYDALAVHSGDVGPYCPDSPSHPPLCSRPLGAWAGEEKVQEVDIEPLTLEGRVA